MVIYWDIETSYMVAATWGLFNQNIHYSQIIDDWYIISICYKIDGQKRVHSLSIKEPGDDKEVVTKMHTVLSKATLLIHHNGNQFDIKKFNARAIYHGLDPIPNILQDDTLKMARNRFKFTSNRLDYLGEFLKLGRKVKTESGLWMKVLQGNKSAIRKMVKYNKGDVELLEAVYKKLSPWCGSKLNQNLLRKTELHCPLCGGLKFIRDGHTYTKTTILTRFKCKECGHTYTKSKKGIAK